MTLKDIHDILATTLYPVAYREFPIDECPPFPVIAYFITSTNNLMADGIVYQEIATLSVELYTDTKDPAAENTLETALASNEIAWNKQESYIEEEHCYQISYEIEVLLNADNN